MRCEAVTAFGRPLESLTLETPIPQGREALVQVTGCGLCHSDLHIHDGYFDLGGDMRLDLPLPLPVVLGHEIEGVVVALGPEAAAANPDVQVGDRVGVYPWIGCGQCGFCTAGDQQLCQENRNLGVQRFGGFADHVLVPEAEALIPAGDLAPGVAGLAMCSGLTAYGALTKIPPAAAREPLLILGLGGVGLMTLAIARERHLGPIIAADIDPKKREAALARGAAQAIDPGALALEEIPLLQAGAAVDTVGSPSTLGFALQALRRGGSAIVVGLYGGALPLPVATVPLRAVTIQGSYVGRLDEAREVVRLFRDGRLDAPILAQRPLAEANAAMADLRAGRLVGRAVLTP